MKIIEISKKFNELINSECFSLSHIGIRWDDRKFEIGDEVPNSYNWVEDDAVSEPEELDGACAIGIDNGCYFDDNAEMIVHINSVLKDCSSYAGQYAYIIKGDRSRNGEDEYEKIIRNAEVVAIIEI